LPQLVERRLLHLSHALGADPEDPGELAQRALRAIQAEAGAHDPQLASVELLQQHVQPRRVDAGHVLVGVLGDWIGQEVAEGARGALVVAHWLLQGSRCAFGGHQPLDLLAA
jgi:hypothetical protein